MQPSMQWAALTANSMQKTHQIACAFNTNLIQFYRFQNQQLNKQKRSQLRMFCSEIELINASSLAFQHSYSPVNANIPTRRIVNEFDGRWVVSEWVSEQTKRNQLNWMPCSFFIPAWSFMEFSISSISKLVFFVCSPQRDAFVRCSLLLMLCVFMKKNSFMMILG